MCASEGDQIVAQTLVSRMKLNYINVVFHIVERGKKARELYKSHLHRALNTCMSQILKLRHLMYLKSSRQEENETAKTCSK